MYVFLFNPKEIDDYFYGGVCQFRIINQLLKYKINKPVGFQLGDLFWHDCRNITKISFNEDGVMHQGSGYDNDRIKDYITELFYSIKELKHELLFSSPMIFCENVYCVALTNIDNMIASNINDSLKKEKYYLGFHEVDLGHPLHVRIYERSLIKKYFIKNNILYYESCDEEKNERVPLGISENINIRLCNLENEYYFEQFPSEPIKYVLSKRGERCLKIQNKRNDPFYKIKMILMNTDKRALKDIKEFSFKTDTEFSYDRIVIKKEKFTKYILNKEHPKGKHKAYVFDKVLDITLDDWEYLKSQIINGLLSGNPNSVKLTKHGIKYDVHIKITGRNQVEKIINTAWIIKEDKNISFVSAYMLEESEQKEDKEVARNLYMDNINFEELFDFAISKAHEVCSDLITTPMFLKTHDEPIFEGECGYAYLKFDGRTKFAKWLVKKYPKTKNIYGGVQYYSPLNSQSYERNYKFIEQVYMILQQNGIPCEMKEYID